MVTVFLTSCEKEQMVLEESFGSTEKIAQQENLPGLVISQDIACLLYTSPSPRDS